MSNPHLPTLNSPNLQQSPHPHFYQSQPILGLHYPYPTLYLTLTAQAFTHTLHSTSNSAEPNSAESTLAPPLSPQLCSLPEPTPKRSLTSHSHNLQKQQFCRTTHLAPLIPSFCNPHPPHTSSLQLFSLLHIILHISAPYTYPTLIPFSAFSFQISADSVICLRTSKPSSLVWLVHPSLIMSFSSSYYHNEHLFRASHHQEIYQKYIHRKGVTPEKSFELQEGQYPEIGEQIRLRGWKRLSKPRTKISKDLVLEFYTNAVRTEEELASGEDYPYTSFFRGKEVDFSAVKIREVLRIKHMTLGVETDFKTRQYEDQRLDEVIKDICMPGAQ
ncbi:hypothetical protein PIB30_064591 [Stylosanthes scabra]|uniref:Putative plant transposon protein domain-containing protein n=1 Tax=Stylosanthes scabra TaxID=79078 RepID=A0ABU6XJP4_9FABA|nr:hypothetical protein [Stylosanthes scabra]